MLRTAAAKAIPAVVMTAFLLVESAATWMEGRQAYRVGVPKATTSLVDFLVTDRAGQPVRDLAAAEIILKIDGRVRPVASLQLVDFTDAPGAKQSPGDPLPPPFGSNVMTTVRSVVILIDDDSIRRGRERDTIAAASDLLDRLPGSAAVVIATPHGGWKTKLTSDRAEARRALSEISGRAFAADDVECRTRTMLDAVRATLVAFSAEAAPTILVVSGGLAGPRQDTTSGSSGLARAAGRVQVRSCDLRLEDFLKIGDAAADARAHVHVIQPDDVLLSTNMDQLSTAPIDLQAGLTTLAGVTGGKLVHLTPSNGNPLVAAAQESSAYYLAGFEPTGAEAPGSTHRVDVQVRRPGVTIVRRSTVRIDNVTARPAAPEAATPAMMVRDPAIRRGLLLRTAGYVSRGPDPAGAVRILALAEPIGAAAGLASAAAGLFDPHGRLVSEWTSTGTSLGTGPIIAPLAGAPGPYRLRVAAVDAAGRAGTADYFVDATLAPAGPLTLSALMLAVQQNGVLRPVLEFSTEPAALASLEVYGETQGKPIHATLEVSDSLNGPAILAAPVQVAATRDADAFILTAPIPMAGLAPGDYVVRVTVNLQDHAQGRVVRTLRKR
jgi:VWFA-related protein